MAAKNKKKSNSTSKKQSASKQQVAEKKTTTVQSTKIKKSDDKKTQRKKAPVKNTKPNIFVRLGRYIKSVNSELKKVSWLSREDLMKNTSVVAGIVAITTLLCWIADSGLGALATLLIDK